MAGSLHAAAEMGDLQTAQRLIEQHADVNSVDERGIWPLLVAAYYGHVRLPNC